MSPTNATAPPPQTTTPSSLRVLIVDDSEHDATLMRKALERAGLTIHAATCDTPETLAAALAEDAPWDVILTDHSMPRLDSFAVLAAVADAKSPAPVIIVSGQIGEENLVKAVHAGAVDYVSKERLALVVPAVERATRTARAEREREHLEGERRLFFELSEDLFAITDLDGRFRQMNRSWTRTLGRSDEELRAEGLRGLVHPADRAATRAMMEGLANGVAAREFENRLVATDGTTRTFLWNAIADVQAGAIYVVARDVTTRKHAEETLLRQDRMASLGQLVAGVAHEVNNPLMYMLGNLDIAQMLLHDEEAAADVPPRARATLAKVRESLDSVTRGARRIETIATAMRAVAQPAAPAGAGTDANEVLRAALDIARPQFPAGIVIERALDAHAASAASGSELSQVFLNLLTNAADVLRNVPTPRLVVRSFDDAAGVHVEIQDNGPGMPDDVKAKIFRPFFTTKAEGVGLGLSICHTIVHNHGGTIVSAWKEPVSCAWIARNQFGLDETPRVHIERTGFARSTLRMAAAA